MSKYSIISGSSRNDNQSIRVASLLARSLREASTEDEVFVLDLSEVTLPQWHEGFWSEPIPDPVWAEVSEELTQSDGIILVCPEWNGIVPPALLNVFLLTSRGEMAHKPGLVVTVSAQHGWCIPNRIVERFCFEKYSDLFYSGSLNYSKRFNVSGKCQSTGPDSFRST